jgi:hypothetical protein
VNRRAGSREALSDYCYHLAIAGAMMLEGFGSVSLSLSLSFFLSFCAPRTSGAFTRVRQRGVKNFKMRGAQSRVSTRFLLQPVFATHWTNNV